jgi:hypothetical protein
MNDQAELTIDRDVPTLDTAGKRALIEAELRKDAGRPDREIARVVGNGICHKTVGAHRERLGIASPLGNFTPPTPTEHRQMLIDAAEDFDKKYPPGPSEVRTAEEAVDNAIAEGKISYAAAGAGDAAVERHGTLVQAAVDQCRGAILRTREERQAQADAAGEKNEERCILLPRKEVTIQHDDELGEWIIRQRNWPDDDGVVTINDEDIHRFVDILTDHLGYGRAP